MMQEKNNKNDEEKWGAISLFVFNLIPNFLQKVKNIKNIGFKY